MSARGYYLDRETCVLWVAYEGRGDELPASLSIYNVLFIMSPHRGRIGLPYRQALSEDALAAFVHSAARVVSTLVARHGTSRAERDDFATALIVVQSCQTRDTSVEGRQISAFFRNARIRKGVPA